MRKLFITILFSVTLLLTAADTYAQCAMCRRVAETGQTGNSKRGLNAGILYLLAIPYVLGGVGAYMWWKNRKN
jgi:hypothetical protein